MGKAISPSPLTGARVICEREGSGVTVSCRDSGPAMETEASREAQGPAVGTGVTFEIWDQLKMATSVPQEGGCGYRGEGTL